MHAEKDINLPKELTVFVDDTKTTKTKRGMLMLNMPGSLGQWKYEEFSCSVGRKHSWGLVKSLIVEPWGKDTMELHCPRRVQGTELRLNHNLVFDYSLPRWKRNLLCASSVPSGLASFSGGCSYRLLLNHSYRLLLNHPKGTYNWSIHILKSVKLCLVPTKRLNITPIWARVIFELFYQVRVLLVFSTEVEKPICSHLAFQNADSQPFYPCQTFHTPEQYWPGGDSGSNPTPPATPMGVTSSHHNTPHSIILPASRTGDSIWDPWLRVRHAALPSEDYTFSLHLDHFSPTRRI